MPASDPHDDPDIGPQALSRRAWWTAIGLSTVLWAGIAVVASRFL